MKYIMPFLLILLATGLFAQGQFKEHATEFNEDESSQYGAITLDNDEFNVTISMTHDKERDLRQASMGYLTAAYMKGQLRCKKRSSYNVETIFVDPGGAVKINATCKNLFGSANELEIILLEEEVMTMYSLRF